MNALSPVRRYAPPLVLAAVAVAFTALALQLPPVSRTVPILIGTVTMILVLVDLVTRFPGPFGSAVRRALNPDCAEETGEVDREVTERGELIAIAWICGFTTLVMMIGFKLAIPIYLAAYMLIQGRIAPLKTALVTAGFMLGIWVLFELTLSLRLYGGILF